jgi:hypothetical protein
LYIVRFGNLRRLYLVVASFATFSISQTAYYKDFVPKVLRYIQPKSSHRTAATANVPVNVNLESKPGGCVIWMRFDPQTVELGPYLWFGARPGEPALSLGSKIGRHSKGDKNGLKAFRPNIRVLPIGRFEKLITMDDIVDALFG